MLLLTSLIRDLPKIIAARIENDRGATAVEYGLMVALIAVVIVGSVALLGGTLDTNFTSTNDCLTTANTATPNCP